MPNCPIQFKQKAYIESDHSLLVKDLKEFADMAVRAVSFNGSGGFPAKEPERKPKFKKSK